MRWFLAGERDVESYKKRALQCGAYGVVTGLVTGPLFTWLRLRADDVTPDSVWDRCYRLRHNKCQVRAKGGGGGSTLG